MYNDSVIINQVNIISFFAIHRHIIASTDMNFNRQNVKDLNRLVDSYKMPAVKGQLSLLIQILNVTHLLKPTVMTIMNEMTKWKPFFIVYTNISQNNISICMYCKL